MTKGIPFELTYYLELVELTGKSIRSDKAGHIDEVHPILARLNIEPENWFKLTTQFSHVFHGAAGRPQAITSYCETMSKKRRKDITNSKRLLA